MALENPEMGGEIEEYLMKKLDGAIKDPAFTEKNKIQELKDLLLKKGSSEQEKRREKLYQLNNVLTEWQMKSKKKGSCIPKALHSCQLSKILKQIKADLKKKISEGGSTQSSLGKEQEESLPKEPEASLPKEPESYRWSSQHVDPEKVHGLEDKAMTLERILVRGERNDHFKAIGIGGIGKTTLCQFLLTRQAVKDHFFPRIWVCMSKQPREDSDNRKEIVRRMLTALGVEEKIIDSADNTDGLAGLLSALRLQLMDKRYLIVLDDAWNSDEFYQQLNSRSTQATNVVEHLAYSLPKGYGGAVIVTSRSEELAKKMVGEESLHCYPHGLEDKAMTLERILVQGKRNDHFKAIGIVGIAGIGKTTLCQFLLTRQAVTDHFFPRIWVCMSKQPGEDSDNRKKIVRRMLTALGVEVEIIDSADNTHGLAGLLSALRLQLMGKRYLIVLDDAWNSDEFYLQLNSQSTQARNVVERLAYSLPKGYGGAVIVTSRSEELAKKMVGEENLHRLPRTDTESCWNIFKDSVQEDGEQFLEDLEKLKDEIASKCFGLPLAAKVMGQIVNENSKKNSTGGGGGGD